MPLDPQSCRNSFSDCGLWKSGLRLLAILATLALPSAVALANGETLPLAAVRYFNPFLGQSNWAAGGSAIYFGGTASVSNYSGAIPIGNLGGTNALVLNATNPPGGWWNAFLKISGNPLNWLRTGTNPALHFRLNWSAVPTNGQWNMLLRIQGGPDYSSVLNADIPLNAFISVPTNTWQDVYIPASAFVAIQPSIDLTHIWDVALLAAGNYQDRCILNIAALDLVPSANPAKNIFKDYIKVNQVGYPPLSPSKIALVSWPTNFSVPVSPTFFRILNASNGQPVYSNLLTHFVQPNQWQAPGWTLDGDSISQGDFGSLRTPGTYRVEVPELASVSQDFSIGTNVFQPVLRSSLRFFYYSRSGVPIIDPFAEGKTRAAVHPETTNASYNYDPGHGQFNFGAATTRDVHGGWFDAGDTHMDAPATATACWFLLETLRDFGENVPGQGLNLPESSAQTNDLVPLVMWGIDWLGRMQNADGSVCHYVVGNPSTATQPQQVSDISSFATACAGAACAKAYTILGPRLQATQAGDLLSRARLAWQWLTNHPSPAWPRLPLVNGADGGGWDTNPYWGTALDDARDRTFAAVELFEATGESGFNAYVTNAFFAQNGGSPLNGPLFGANTTGYGSDNVIDYLRTALNFAFMDYARSTQPVDPGLQNMLKAAFQHQADVLTNYNALSGYRIPMLYPDHLYWGSCGGVLAPSAMVLARAHEWTGNAQYASVAEQALHFICGRNPVNRVFVSGFGDYPHGSDFYSQFWTNLRDQPPGYLGGNINVDGSAAPVVAEPWKRFINTQDADMTEPGVYWNSAFAWIAAYAANDTTLPTPRIEAAAAGPIVSWPLRSAAFALESTPQLPATWTVVTNAPALTNRCWKISVPAARQCFYRLRAL